jgi:hypothetical protein
MQEHTFVRAYIFESIIPVLYRIPMKERKQVLIMGVSIAPKVSIFLSELTVSIENESGEWEMIC